jgi:hypothetical protein
MPSSIFAIYGTAKAVPFQNADLIRGSLGFIHAEQSSLLASGSSGPAQEKEDYYQT